MVSRLLKQTHHTLTYKKYADVEFVTRGYDYYFLFSVPVEEAAAIAVLDFVSCQPASGSSLDEIP